MTAVTDPRLSVVVPAFNEEAVLPEFHRRLTAVLDGIPGIAEVIYVNDGSTDRTAVLVNQFREYDARIGLVDLSRNFGKEIALTAGLDHARGQATVVIDADLQDPPELIPDLIAQWEAGFDVVYAQRISRSGETLLKRVTAAVFYRLIQRVGGIHIPRDTGDFRLLSRRAMQALGKVREQHRFMKGLFAWIGFPQKAVPYQREPRFAGTTKWNYGKLWNLALEGFTSFTIAPLKLATYVGGVIALLAFAFALFIVYKTLVFGDPVKGYPSLMVAVLFLGGIQLVALGIIGEYLGRMFMETKQRPLYFVKEYLPAATARCASKAQ